MPFDRYGFLFVFYCNYVSILHHFQEIIAYFRKRKDVTVTTPRGVDPYGTGGNVPPNIYEGGRPSTGAPPMDPAGGLPSPRPPVFFYVPPIIL